jgi:flagellin-like protein
MSSRILSSNIFYKGVSELVSTILLILITLAVAAIVVPAILYYASSTAERAEIEIERARIGAGVVVVDAFYVPDNNTVVVYVVALEPGVEFVRAYVDGTPATPVKGFNAYLPVGAPWMLSIQPQAPLEPGAHQVVVAGTRIVSAWVVVS